MLRSWELTIHLQPFNNMLNNAAEASTVDHGPIGCIPNLHVALMPISPCHPLSVLHDGAVSFVVPAIRLLLSQLVNVGHILLL